MLYMMFELTHNQEIFYPTDIAEVSMKQCEQRYKDLRYSRNHRRYNQSQKIYDAQFITADCTKVCLFNI